MMIHISPLLVSWESRTFNCLVLLFFSQENKQVQAMEFTGLRLFIRFMSMDERYLVWLEAYSIHFWRRVFALRL